MVNTFFRGSKVSIKADIPECDGVAIKLQGEDKELVVNKTGKVAFLWMNVAQIKVHHAPTIYLLAVSDQIQNICSSEQQEMLYLGYGPSKKRILFESEKPLNGSEFDEFIKLKKHDGSYIITYDIKLDRFSETRKKISASLNPLKFLILKE
ncbi:MAG: hypothetical protein A2161_09395 [Candidatus Schekmanbacteria bacterium RBG_13_48_7]|uniref:Uncharacterized protein n=1 Tax=Candidatus Schekmanbacteria bacterium RBG_13_48_7 TaxID=1817878 RepID=A0A1F7S0Z5_9BACT|nr:MAG: hypothetical protein A2161_09395 [Candidatus Schekmanbacteria bacterium RBG_13_48_7]